MGDKQYISQTAADRKPPVASRWEAMGGFSKGGKAREEKPSLNSAREKESRRVEMARNRSSEEWKEI